MIQTIRDKKTSELVNILEGDNEVVNVIQGENSSYSLISKKCSLTIWVTGHPYEPVLAVSGIDHTVKIFSPDGRSQEEAQAGINISSAANKSSGSSVLSSGRRARGGLRPNEEPHVEGLSSRKRMHQSYQIMSSNDAQRAGGMRDAFITVRADGPFLRMRTVEVGFAEWVSWFGS